MNKAIRVLPLIMLGLLFTLHAGFSFGKKKEVPAEYNQKVLLHVSDDYQMHQATLSKYDVGDLQNFHTQHTLPITIEGAFREVFPQAEMMESKEGIEDTAPNVPAIFEVRMIDIANDVYNEATDYRGELTLAVAMKGPDDEIIWQEAFRGEGYAKADPQFGTQMGPDEAVVDALRDAIDQMQKALLKSPEIREHMQLAQQARIEGGESEKKL